MIPLLASLALSIAGVAVEERVQQPPAGAWWGDVELPRGFALALDDGLVANRAPDGVPALRYDGGLLRASVPLRRLEPPAEGAARRTVERGEGEPAGELTPDPGLELTWERPAGGWGYLRVLEAAPERVRLEVTYDPRPDATRLERRPAELRAESREAGVALDWDAGGAPCRVERRPLGAGAVSWELLAEDAVGELLDSEGDGAHVLEYRVSLAGPGPRFGARARGVAGFLPEEQTIRLSRGQGLNLLTGEDDPVRVDLTVEFVGNKGAQLGCGPGVRTRVLTPSTGGSFELPAAGDGGYRDQRLFLTSDRALAVHLPEGLYARVRLEEGEGGEVYLQRQLDLAGGRAFPPTPGAPRIVWKPERGVVIAPPSGEADAERPRTVLVEREAGFRSGDWRELGPLAAEDDPLVDPPPLERGLVRYRLRYVLAGGPRSLPGPAATALVGDDGAEGTAGLLADALADLGHPVFERRLRAEGVLVALGPGAADQVRALLEAEDPELVAAARRILARTPAAPAEEGQPPPEGGPETDLAPVILAGRARAAGLGEPPPGWMAPEPWARASAMLRQYGPGRVVELEPWRELLAVEDPDPALRLLATALGSWPIPVRPAGVRFRPTADARAEPFDLGALVLGLAGEADARRDLAARLDPSRPWAAYVQLQILHALERAGRGPLGEGLPGDEREVIERAALAASLLDRDAEEGATDVFLEAALEVFDEPELRLAAAANLADLRLGRAAGPPGGTERAPREVIALPAADGELLWRELEALRDADAGPTDLVLPAGVYTMDDGRQTLVVSGADLRLLGQGDAELRVSLSVMRGSDVVLEGLRLVSTSGSAVMVDRSAVLLRDCTVLATVQALQATDGVIELDRTDLLPRPGSGQHAGGVGMGRLSLFIARESCIVGRDRAISGPRTAWLERCVVDGGTRNGIEGRMDGEALLVACFVRADGDALSNVQAGVLEGVVLAAGEEAARTLGPGVAVCPLHVLHTGAPGALEGARRAERCLLGR